jgi:hypothetical protein
VSDHLNEACVCGGGVAAGTVGIGSAIVPKSIASRREHSTPYPTEQIIDSPRLTLQFRSEYAGKAPLAPFETVSVTLLEHGGRKNTPHI